MPPSYSLTSRRTIGRFAWRTLTSAVLLLALLGASGDIAGSSRLKGRVASYLYPLLFTVTTLGSGLVAVLRSYDRVSEPGSQRALTYLGVFGLIFLVLGLRAIKTDLNAGR